MPRSKILAPTWLFAPGRVGIRPAAFWEVAGQWVGVQEYRKQPGYQGLPRCEGMPCRNSSPCLKNPFVGER